MDLLNDLQFFSLRPYRQRKYGQPAPEIRDVPPVVTPDIPNDHRPSILMRESIPEIMFSDFTARFIFSNEVTLLAHWPMGDVGMKREDFVNFCQQQAIALQAQLWKAGSDLRVSFYEMCDREPSKDDPTQYTYNTWRYTVAMTIFESILRAPEGCKFAPHGVCIK